MPGDFDLSSAVPVQDTGFDLASAVPIQQTAPQAGATEAGRAAAMSFLPPMQTPYTPSSVVGPMATTEGLGVGQGAIQAGTFGYGMPALRQAFPQAASQIRRPTGKESLVGAGLTMPFGVPALAGMAGKMGGIARTALPLVEGAAWNPSDTKFASPTDVRRIPGAALGVLGQVTGAGLGAVYPELKDALKRALKFPKNDLKADQNLDVALPEIFKTDQSLTEHIQDIKEGTLEKFNDVVLQTKNRLWQEAEDLLKQTSRKRTYVPTGEQTFIPGTKNPRTGQVIQQPTTALQPLESETALDMSSNAALSKAAKPKVEPTIPETADQTIAETKKTRILIKASDIGKAMRDSVSTRTRKLYPETADAIDKVAARYRGRMTPMAAEEFLQDANKDLATAYYAKGGQGQYVARGNDHIMATYAEAQALRKALYDAIDQGTGKGPEFQAVKRKLGALMDIYNVGRGRVNVAQRQQPVSLQEALSYAGGMADIFGGVIAGSPGAAAAGIGRIAISKLAKDINNPNVMIRRGFQNYGQDTMPRLANNLQPIATELISPLDQYLNGNRNGQ